MILFYLHDTESEVYKKSDHHDRSCKAVQCSLIGAELCVTVVINCDHHGKHVVSILFWFLENKSDHHDRSCKTVQRSMIGVHARLLSDQRDDHNSKNMIITLDLVICHGHDHSRTNKSCSVVQQEGYRYI